MEENRRLIKAIVLSFVGVLFALFGLTWLLVGVVLRLIEANIYVVAAAAVPGIVLFGVGILTLLDSYRITQQGGKHDTPGA